MHLSVTFRNIEHTPSLDERIKEKTEKLAKYIDGNFNIKWTCEIKQGQHIAEIDLHGPKFNYHASAKSDSLYKTLDLVVSKIEKQIAKKKDKWKNNLHNNTGKLVILDYEQAWSDQEILEKKKAA